MVCAMHRLFQKEEDDRIMEGDFDPRKEMEKRTKRNTVPQIYIDDYHVGGFDDLSALDMEGKLDKLLAK